MNYYPRHIGDYIGATAHLSMLEDGAYNRLMDWYYLDEQPIPNDTRAIYRRCRAQSPEEREAVDVVLSEFFQLDPDANAFRHSRIDEELSKYQDKSKKASDAAKRRWNADASKSNASASKKKANASPEQSERNANQEPITNNQEPRAKESIPRTRKPAAPKKSPLPENFTVSERVDSWAAEKGFTRLAEHHEAFVSKALANGYVYADWDQAFMNAIRDDWAGLRSGKASGMSKQRQIEERNASLVAQVKAGMAKMHPNYDDDRPRLEYENQ